MRILFAGDEHHYSEYALNEVLRLAMNTWADVTLMGVLPAAAAQEAGRKPPVAGNHALRQALAAYRDAFLGGWPQEASPYALQSWKYEWLPIKSGLWEELRVTRGAKKDLKLHLRVGEVAAEILTEAREEGVDLIVLGCTKGDQCLWNGPLGVPQKVANDAACSVLLVKEDQPTQRILACFDQTSVSQESLEMINQMATIHQAQLQLIGLTKEGGMKPEAYTRLIELGDYYSDRQIKVTTKLAEVSDAAGAIAKETQQDLLALWVGRKSLLDVFFPKDWVGRFISTCQSSVLVLR
jgi:nucleotide-binding universal stress UspA family protein